MLLLEIEALSVHYRIGPFWNRRILRALDGVTLGIEEGESVGVVGESGSGKTTLGRAILGLLPPAEGRIRFRGRPLAVFSERDLRAYRRQVQIVFQDPFESLNPRLTVLAALEEALALQGMRGGKTRRQRVAELLSLVGLSPEHAARYPHEFSGGQRQRIGIARALAVRPSLLVLDEPVSALDVSVQAQILELLRGLRREMGLTYLFIAHDLAVVRSVCERVAVLYLGRLMESGPVEEVFRRPAHPYTEALLQAVPDMDASDPPRAVVRGEAPRAGAIPSGCPFHPRCPRVQPRCAVERPMGVAIAVGRWSACHFAHEVWAGVARPSAVAG
jgi:oligopeptide/dipeptide ABC transporter ATP-binding protein